MVELFADERESDTSAILRDATIVAELPSSAEPATATIGSGKAQPLPPPIPHEPKPETPRRRMGVSGIAAGVVLGVGLGGGGAMYILASGSDQPVQSTTAGVTDQRPLVPPADPPRGGSVVETDSDGQDASDLGAPTVGPAVTPAADPEPRRPAARRKRKRRPRARQKTA